MKFLEYPQLELLASSLSYTSPSVLVTTRLEAYSCKSVSRERKLFKLLDSELTSDLELSASVSPPERHLSLIDSPFGPLDKKENRKTLWLLIATLNAAFPDHDFSCVKAEEFSREESAQPVLIRLSDAMSGLDDATSATPHYRSFASSLGGDLSVSPGATASPPLGHSPRTLSGVNPALRQVLDPIIDLQDCEVFSYLPDLDSDPHAVDTDEDYADEDSSLASSSAFGSDDRYACMWEMDELDSISAEDAFDRARPPVVASARPSGVAPFYASVSVPATPNTMTPGSWPSLSVLSEKLSCASGTSATFSSLFEATEAGLEESTGGLLWSNHFFLLSRKQRRILYISVCGRKATNGRHGRASTVGGLSPYGVVAASTTRPALPSPSLKRHSLDKSCVSRKGSSDSIASSSGRRPPIKKVRHTRQASAAD